MVPADRFCDCLRHGVAEPLCGRWQPDQKIADPGRPAVWGGFVFVQFLYAAGFFRRHSRSHPANADRYFCRDSGLPGTSESAEKGVY